MEKDRHLRYEVIAPRHHPAIDLKHFVINHPHEYREMFLHFHEFCEIIWFRSIAGDVTIDKEFYPLQGRLLCFIPSFNVHEFRLDFSERIEYYIIQFDPELIRYRHIISRIQL